MAFPIRPAVVTAAFAVLFAVIANLSWATAMTTTGPWFDVTVSLATYAIAIVLATLLAVVLVQHASARAASLESSLRRLDRRIALLKASPAKPTEDGDMHEVSIPGDPAASLDSEIEAFTGGASRGIVRLEKAGHDTLVPLPGAARVVARPARTEVLRLLVRERIALRESQARMWALAAGPTLLAVVFLAIAGPMLPGADGFAAAHYQLNTTLVLFLAYGLAPLVAWSLISLGLMGSAPRREAA